MEWLIPKDWVKNCQDWMHKLYEKLFVLNTKINDLETKQERYSEERMRRELWETKEAIEDNRSFSSIFKKLENCEKEIFRLYDAFRTINKEQWKSRTNEGEDRAKARKESFGPGHHDQSYCNKNATVVVHIEKKQRLRI